MKRMKKPQENSTKPGLAPVYRLMFDLALKEVLDRNKP